MAAVDITILLPSANVVDIVVMAVEAPTPVPVVAAELSINVGHFVVDVARVAVFIEEEG